MTAFGRIVAACDGILVINLDARTDKWEAFQKAWEPYLPFEKVHRFSGVVGVGLPGYGEKPWFMQRTGERSKMWAGAAGCAIAQKKAIQFAKEAGWKRTLIFEDDAEPSVYLEKEEDVDISALEHAGLLYLGFSKCPPFGYCAEGRADELGIWRIPGALTTHAYVVFEEAYDVLIDALPSEHNVWPWIAWNRAVDTWYREAFAGASGLRIYAVIPQLVVQADGISDIMGSHVENGNRNVEAVRRPRSVGRWSYSWKMCRYVWSMYVKRMLNGRRRLRRARKNGFPGPKCRKKA